MDIANVLGIFFSFVIGVIFGGMALLLSRGMLANRQIRIAQKKAAKIVAESGIEAKGILNEAKIEVDKSKTVADNEIRERRTEIQRQENRINQKESNLERKLEDVERQEQNLVNKEKEIESIHTNMAEVKEKQLKQLGSDWSKFGHQINKQKKAHDLAVNDLVDKVQCKLDLK